MKKYLFTIIVSFAAFACTRERPDGPLESLNLTYGRDLPHDMICLGARLENPYKTINISKAMASVYPTKSRIPVETTDYYVRFLPADDTQFARLEALDLELSDHPVDYEIVRDGDWYHDPTLPEESITWQYALVPKDFDFPDGIRYEILDECFLHEHSASTKAADVDWDAVERRSYELSGNGDMLLPQTRAGDASVPSGRISIIDPDYAGGKPVGVSGVRVVCNSFIRFDSAYTDRDGYYSMKKSYSSKIKYRLMFKNEKGFSIGFNFIIVPASMSTLGSADPSGVSMTVTSDSETKLYTRCVVNNAAYDYMTLCGEDALNLPSPPDDIRIWIFNKLENSSSIMMHHGTVVDQGRIAAFLGTWAALVKVFAPDITIGTASSSEFCSIYGSTVHEMAHSSHFANAGKAYWNDYIRYILESYVNTGSCYGDGDSENAGLCDVGESWAYYLQSKIYASRYGGDCRLFGSSYWFKPQIFRYLDESGIGVSEAARALDAEVRSRNALKDKLIALYPSRRRVIEQVFNRYN